MAIHISRPNPVAAISDHRLTARLGVLLVGTAAMGGGIALLVWSRLGMVPMDVLHIGVSHALGWTFGESIIACQLLLAATFVPLRIRPGIGTAAGFVIPAAVADTLLAILPAVESLPIRVTAFAGGGVLFCAGVATYLLADLGPLPRDGIMVALAGARENIGQARSWRTALVRIGIDAAFVTAGAAMLGPADAVHVGALAPGTVLLAAGSGPLIVFFMRRMAPADRASTRLLPGEHTSRTEADQAAAVPPSQQPA